MTIQGAIYELNNMLSSNDIPCYWKPVIKKIIETVEQIDGDLISRDFMKKIGATCIAKRSETGELVAISSIDYLPSAEKTTLRTEKTTITDGDLISRQKEVKK